ncbi:MAG TPA: Do family serine endopeptidase [Caulobacteraceae bacterium]|jgi:serine protease Do|nr:Do family serine endopeptidase [Caulobacteraceae bacterium]
MHNKFFGGAAVGALAAAAIVGAGGRWTHANAAPGTAGAPVNTPAPAPAPRAGAPASFADIVQRVAPAVVSIDVEGKASRRPVALQQGPRGFDFGSPDDQGDGQDNPFGFDLRRLFPQMPQGEAPEAEPTQATGSGFFISADGYIVTNNHVVEGADTIKVRTNDDRTLTAKLVGRDPATDLAVIKVQGGGFPFVSFEESALPRVGDWVVAVGNPFNLGGTATAGIVSALGRSNVSGSSFVDYMQIDAPINRGNSGGPTFDLYGRVVGVNSAIYSPSGGSVGIGFDIPADVAAGVAKQLIADGKVTRGYIGASIQGLTPDIADSLGVDVKKGALVAELTPGAPAEKGGLRAGDLVTKVNGRDVTSSADLTRQVALVKPGQDIRLQVRREGRMQEVVIRSGVRPAEAVLARTGYEAPEAPTEPDGTRVLGMRLAPDAKGGGVAVQGVTTNSDAGKKGLKQGDVIVAAGGRQAQSPADVSAAAAEARKAGRNSVLLLVARDGRRMFVPVEVGQAAG